MSRGAEVLNKVTHNEASLFFVIIPLLLLSWVQLVLAADIVNLSPAKGGKLPAIRLPIPKDLDERNYLGLSGEGLFRIPQIKADGVLIEVFNTYCPICQTTTAALGELYRQIESNSDLKDRIKMIGIGVGNNDLEAMVFKQAYNIPFPTFSDENYEIHKDLGEVRTPFFIALKINGGHEEIVQTHLGALTDSTGFLDLMLQAYGIKQEELLIKQAGSPPSEPAPR